MEIVLKRIIGFLFSSRLMALIILTFAVSIAIATFIENDFGSQTARAIVYNAWWFNALLFLGIINLTGTIISGRLYKKQKLTIFVFHLAFLFILIGAAITRFFGFEGIMHIRSGDSSNSIISSSNFVTFTVQSGNRQVTREKEVYFSPRSRNFRTIRLKVGDQKIKATCIQFIPGAREKIVSSQNGKPMVEFVVSAANGRKNFIVSEDAPVNIGNVLFTMNDSSNKKGVDISVSGNQVSLRLGVPGTVMNMMSQQNDSITRGSYHPLLIKSLYHMGGLMFVATEFNTSADRVIESVGKDNSEGYPDALAFQVTSGQETKTIRYMAASDRVNSPVNFRLNNLSASISYGPKIISLPFSLNLERFILERYPGSNSPSWFESQVVLSDARSNINEKQRVYMNNVLKHGGFRFYQSSYDNDEKGTIFSVNHDYAGTWVTYLGYLMLAVGIVLSLFNRNSRFAKLSQSLSQIRNSTTRYLLLLLTGLFIGFNASASQIPDSISIDKKQADKFGKLLIQDPAGRIKPLNTLSSELLRKVSGKTEFMQQNSDQVLLGMLAYPDFWQNVPMIKVSHPEVREILKTKEPYVSFAGVFDTKSESMPYILSTYVSRAYQKKPAIRNTFDTEIIRVDERVNLCYQVYTGNFLRIFPKRDDKTGTWYSPANSEGKFTGNDSVFVSSIIPLYIQTLAQSNRGITPVADEAITALHNFQTIYGKELIPSEFRIKLEILSNRINLFDRLGSAYGITGFLLLMVHFISIFIPAFKTKSLMRISVFWVGLLFMLHLFGLIARWIVSGHAPWSNGYESLIYIAFATVLAGLILSRKSSVTLSVTSILAWLILFVAHLNWMDPQITNLVPVLKSYWLLIHVAVITASYGFLAMGAMLAFLNLILMISQTKNNYLRTGKIITEFSMVIEMTLIIGLYLLTIGTFLGGVWANESWGRYWGWDPKETWALVSVLIYAFVAHMRLVPGLKGNYTFNLMSLLAFSTIIMTYFGVNYYLSGLHSYAKGDPLPVPVFVYYTLAVIGLVALLAWENQRRMKKIHGEISETSLNRGKGYWGQLKSIHIVTEHVDDF